MRFQPFAEARGYVHSLELKNVKEWQQYCKSGKKPEDIPSNPGRVYEEWTNWGDWFGMGTIATQDRQYRPFEQAREYARSFGLKSQEDYDALVKQ
jgi:hypothetical protein